MLKKMISAVLALLAVLSPHAGAAWLFEEKDISSGDFDFSNERSIVFFHKGSTHAHPNQRVDVFGYDGELLDEDMGNDDYMNKWYYPYKIDPTPMPTPSPVPETAPYYPASDEAVGFIEKDGRFAAVSSLGERMSGYDYDAVLHDFDMEEIVPKRVSKTYQFETPHYTSSAMFGYDLCGNMVYAKVMQDGHEKYIDTHLNEIDITKEVLYDHLEDMGDRFALAYIGYTKDRPDRYIQPLAIYDKLENKITYHFEGDIIISDTIDDGEHLIYVIPASDWHDDEYGIMDAYGNRAAQDSRILRKIDKSKRYVNVLKDGLEGIMDLNGNVIIEPQYAYVEPYGGDELFGTRTYGQSSVWDVMDTKGNSIFAYSSAEHYYKLKKDGYWLANFGGGHYKLLRQTDELPVLYTDVKAYINGYEIPCYSVNGYCVITAEDLRGYGFDVTWDGEMRTLDIRRNSEYYRVHPAAAEARPVSGQYNSAVPTDIKTYFNGKRIPAYAVDGVTMIKPEDIAEEGISFSYDDKRRRLDITAAGLGSNVPL